VSARQRPKFTFGGGQKSAATPSSAHQTQEPKQPAPPAGPRTVRPPSRQGKRIVSTYVDQDAWMQLRMLNLRTGRSTQELMVDAIDLLFQQHGLNRIARGTPGEGES
jgi:hypothetical protein